MPPYRAAQLDSPLAAAPVYLRAVSKTFDPAVRAVAPLDLDIPAGQFLSILGPSGCGKSTLLRLIAGLERPTAGSVTIDVDANGNADAHADLERATHHHRRLAYVFQDPHLMPWRRLIDNVALPLELRGDNSATRRAAALDAIERVGLSDAANRHPSQLSGGMRMRASLARALVTQPRLLLLDEPFAALDELTRQNLDEQLLSLWRGGGMTVIFVTHSVAEAAFLSQRAIVLSKRPARIVLDQPIDLPDRRDAALRSDPAFAAALRPLYDALERGAA